jgi:phosphatidate cytidylyltransferase
MPKFGNLATRVVVAFFGIPLMIFICIAGKIPFLIFVFIIGVVSFFEYSKIIGKRKFQPNLFLGTVSVILIILNSYYYFVETHILVLIIIPIILLSELIRRGESSTANIGTTLLGIFYIGLFSAALVELREFYSDSHFQYDNGGYLILAMFAAIWICDSAAYFVGSAYGKHKVLPHVSPSKSWEGAIAGFIFSVITMLVARELMLEFLSIKDAIIIGIVVGLFGQAGDFVESQIKRDANVKDSSSLIPGHGGIFDRFDSILFSAPIVYLYLYFLNS